MFSLWKGNWRWWTGPYMIRFSYGKIWWRLLLTSNVNTPLCAKRAIKLPKICCLFMFSFLCFFCFESFACYWRQAFKHSETPVGACVCVYARASNHVIANVTISLAVIKGEAWNRPHTHNYFKGASCKLYFRCSLHHKFTSLTCFILQAAF